MAKSRKERDLFTEIDLKIMLINEQIKNHRRSIEKTKRACGWNGPQEMSGIRYSDEPGSGAVHIAFIDGLRSIRLDEERIEKLKDERSELRRSKRRVKKIYESLAGNESEVYYLRVIRKLTQQQAADEMGYSLRQLQRIEHGMADQGLI